MVFLKGSEVAMRPDEAGGLVERLRGIYRIAITDGLGAVGSGEEPDNPNEFVRKFDTPPIQHEAATALEAQAAELAAVKAERDYAVSELKEARIYRNIETGHAEDAEARAERAEAALAEARKELNYLNDAVAVGLPDQEVSRRAKLLVAACRALEGGEG